MSIGFFIKDTYRVFGEKNSVFNFIFFKYCSNVKNCGGFRGFSIYILYLCDARLNRKKIICKLNALIKNHI